MGGLLYKDFVSMKGKKVVTILGVFTASLILMKLWVIRMGNLDFLMLADDQGELGRTIDITSFYLVFCLMYLGVMFVNMWLSKIIEYDEKNKILIYLFAMPLGKRKYVASKYVFIGICYYAFFSLTLLWNVIAMAFAEESLVLDMMQLLPSFSLMFVCLAMMVSAVELPVFLIFGREKGQLFKTSVLLLIAFIAAGYMLFGDLTVLENWDIQILIDWAEQNSFLLALISIISPFINLVFFYLSYRISAHAYERKERDYD